MRLIHCLLLLFSLSLFYGCKKDEAEPQVSDGTTTGGLPTILPNGDEDYLTLDSDYLFDQEALHTYKLIIPSVDLAAINADPAAEEYVEGMLIFNGDTISPVGVRYKGSIGAFAGCLSGFSIFNPSGRKTCTKLSMKVKINWEGREEQFFGLKKLQFHSMNQDPTQMHERLGYWLFGEMGVPSPRSVHAKLKINDEYVGLFALTEQIDNRFAKYHFDDDEGNVYKEVWPLNMEGEPHPDQHYISALKTNEEENPSVDIIKNFGQSLAAAEPEELTAIVQDYMDIDETIAYCVVDRTIRHDDGPFHWYCGVGDCNNHNYYWYEEPNNSRLHLIPWDLDNTFENIITNANPVTPIVDAWGETSNGCEPFNSGGWGFQQWSAACDNLTQTWTTYDDLYELKKEELINGPLSVAQANQMIDIWKDQIHDATLEAQNLHGDAITIGEWESAIATLKNQLEFARNQ